MPINRFFYLLSFLFFVIALPVSPESGQVPPLLQTVRTSISVIQPFQVRFEQQLIVDDELIVEESGEILFKNPQQIRWEYLKPERKIFLLEGDFYQFYEVEENQLTRGEIEEKNQQWFWQLLFSDEIKEIKVGVAQGDRILLLQDETQEIDIEIHLNKENLPSRIIKKDASGATEVLKLKRYKKKVKVSAADFELKLPDDVVIIDSEKPF